MAADRMRELDERRQARSRYESDAAVEAFEAAVVEAESDERREARAGGPREPGVEVRRRECGVVEVVIVPRRADTLVEPVHRRRHHLDRTPVAPQRCR
ncbi:MAG: hypothetical protein M3406_01580 [Chloroflexota bacterium]|nr:hypothetical protein [Chloroflexota bacterium]